MSSKSIPSDDEARAPCNKTISPIEVARKKLPAGHRVEFGMRLFRNARDCISHAVIERSNARALKISQC